MYTSPFTGRTFNFDYNARWRPKNAEPTSPRPPPPPLSPNSKVLTWDFNWNFNRGVKGDVGTTTPVITTVAPITEETTSVSPTSGLHSGHVKHGKIDVNWSFDLNHGGAATSVAQTSSTEKSIKSDEVEKEEAADEIETTLDETAEENDIDITHRK